MIIEAAGIVGILLATHLGAVEHRYYLYDDQNRPAGYVRELNGRIERFDQQNRRVESGRVELDGTIRRYTPSQKPAGTAVPNRPSRR